MTEKHNVSDVMEITMEKIKAMIDVNTVIGEAIRVSEDTVIIPASKVSFGFGTGGSDFSNKNNTPMFGGGSGAGVTMTPMCFLVVHAGNVKVVSVEQGEGSAINKAIDLVPELIDKVSALIKKDNKDTQE